MRYRWSSHKTRERAEASLEDDYATGTVSTGEQPKIEAVKDHRGHVLRYDVTLEDYS
jgi:hypothetical protein